MPDQQNLPIHVGVIMDGNGRWAKKKMLPRNIGHKQGADVFGKIVRYAAKRGIRHFTAYAFSTENWKRPPEEVNGIMDLLRSYLADVDRYRKENIRVRVIGCKTALAEDIQDKIRDLERKSKDNTGLSLNIALNYGGREEILHGAKELAKAYLSGDIGNLDDVDETAFSSFLYTAGQPDVDLIIRTSGECRISNFLLWQGAYAEYVFPEVLWPDFTPKHFDDALAQYASRERRIGASD